MLAEFFSSFDIWQVLPAFVFLIAIIDPLGNMPITINLEKNGTKINVLYCQWIALAYQPKAVHDAVVTFYT